MGTADTLALYAVRAPFAKRDMSALMIVPLLLRRLIEYLLALDHSSFFLIFISIALPSNFVAIVGKCVVTEFMRSYLVT